MLETAELVSLHLSDEELPEGWITTTMGQVADIVGGGTPKSGDSSNFAKSGHAWITPADLSKFEDMYICRGRRDLSNEGLRSCSAIILPAGTVLMSSRAPIGYLAVASAPVSTNQGFKSFVCREGIVPEFIYFWLRSIPQTLEQMGSGSTFAEISGRRATQIPVLIAPSVEQRRIAAALQQLLPRVTGVGNRIARVPRLLKRFRQSVLAAACSGRLTEEWRKAYGGSRDAEEPGELPDGWAHVAARELYLDARYGTSVKCGRQTSGVPVVRVPNIAAGCLDLADLKYGPLSAREQDSLSLAAGDLVVCRTNGSLDLIGKAAVIPALPRPHAFASYLIRLRVDRERLLPGFLHVVLTSRVGRDHIEERARTTAGQFNLNLEILRSLQVPLPPVEEQREILRRVEALLELADSIDRRVAAATERAEKLTQATLAKAFRGELVPIEAGLASREGRDFEPASELLRRIRSQPGRAQRNRTQAI